MTKPAATIFSRRNLLAVLGLGGVAAAVSAAPPLPLSWTRRPTGGNWWQRSAYSLERGGFHEWTQEVGSAFHVRSDSGSSTLKLVAVVPLNSKGRRPSSLGRDQAFAAVFEPAAGAAPGADGTYRVDHAKHGELAVFMTAGRGAGGAGRLEAVFN
jgi:hypothetical protein